MCLYGNQADLLDHGQAHLSRHRKQGKEQGAHAAYTQPHPRF